MEKYTPILINMKSNICHLSSSISQFVIFTFDLPHAKASAISLKGEQIMQKSQNAWLKIKINWKFGKKITVCKLSKDINSESLNQIRSMNKTHLLKKTVFNVKLIYIEICYCNGIAAFELSQ